jgi:hypothetical protein
MEGSKQVTKEEFVRKAARALRRAKCPMTAALYPDFPRLLDEDDIKHATAVLEAVGALRTHELLNRYTIEAEASGGRPEDEELFGQAMAHLRSIGE